MVDPFLENLPDPAVIEPLDFETILAAMENDLVARFPDIAPILVLESSAAKKILEVAAYRELTLRARTNDAARANLLAYAAGADLDHVGANSSPSVARMPGEDDDRFRRRILLTVRARNVGSEERYQLTALDADLRVADAIAYRAGRDPRVYVAILSTEAGGVATQGLIDVVSAAFALPFNRLVNGAVTVRSAVSSVADISASLTLVPGTPPTILATAEANLRAAWAREGGLGRDLTRQWIAARLQMPGIYGVNVITPDTDIVKPEYEAVSIGAVSLTVAGENA